MWTLEEAIYVVRELEKKVGPVGIHLGITGSVLYKGSSEKDLDIIVYPHSTTDAVTDLRSLELIGCEIIRHCDHEQCGDGKEVYETKVNGKRVDFFFLK